MRIFPTSIYLILETSTLFATKIGEHKPWQLVKVTYSVGKKVKEAIRFRNQEFQSS